MDKSEGNQTRGLLLEMFPTHKREKEEGRRRRIIYILLKIIILERERGVKKRTLFIELPTISKMDAPVQDLIAGAATFFCTDFSLSGVKECSPVSGECVCVSTMII
jgi:hypothetical protein